MGQSETEQSGVWDTSWSPMLFQGNQYIDFYFPSYMWTEHACLEIVLPSTHQLTLRGELRDLQAWLYYGEAG